MQNAVTYIYNGMLYEYHKYSTYKCKYYFYFISSWIKYDADRIKIKMQQSAHYCFVHWEMYQLFILMQSRCINICLRYYKNNATTYIHGILSDISAGTKTTWYHRGKQMCSLKVFKTKESLFCRLASCQTRIFGLQ